MLAQRAHCCAKLRTSVSRRAAVVRASGGNGSSGAFAEGQKVKVTSSIKVFHAPKHADGLDLSGMEGVVLKDVTNFKGKVLSANFPYRVEFVLSSSDNAKPAKFQAHLGEDELQAI